MLKSPRLVLHTAETPVSPTRRAPLSVLHKSTKVSCILERDDAFYVLREEAEAVGDVTPEWTAVLHLTRPGASYGDYTEILQSLLGSLDPDLDFEEIDAAFRAYHAALAIEEARWASRTISIRAGVSRPPVEIQTRGSDFVSDYLTGYREEQVRVEDTQEGEAVSDTLPDSSALGLAVTVSGSVSASVIQGRMMDIERAAREFTAEMLAKG